LVIRLNELRGRQRQVGSLASTFYVGIKSKDYVCNDETLKFSIILCDIDGNPIPNKNIFLTILDRNNNLITEDIVLSTDKPLDFQYKLDPNNYSIIASIVDDKGKISKTSVLVSVLGIDSNIKNIIDTNSNMKNVDRVNVKQCYIFFDQKKYKVATPGHLGERHAPMSRRARRPLQNPVTTQKLVSRFSPFPLYPPFCLTQSCALVATY